MSIDRSMQPTQTYQERSREYLAKAYQELEAGDLTQAAEKGWGAASQMVKAVADMRGLEHRSHRSILLVAQQLARETGDTELDALFDTASILHRNFYEDTLDHEGVERRLHSVAQFVDRVEQLLST